MMTEPMVRVVGAKCSVCGKIWDEWRDDFDAEPESMPVVRPFRVVQIETVHSDCLGQILFELEPVDDRT